MSSEVLGRFLLRVARPGLPHALWLLDLALPLAEEAVEVTAPAIKAPDTAWQPRVCQNKCFFSAAATSTGGKDGDEPYAQPCCRDEAPGLASLPCGVARCVLGSGASADPAMVLCAPQLTILVCRDRWDPPLSRWTSWSQGKGETGRLRNGQAAGSRAVWGGARRW